MRGRILSVAVLVLAAGAIGADDRPIDRSEVDRRVVKVVYDAAVLGTDVFNKGRHDECFRLYQGVLSAVHPFLDHRPSLATAVKDRMDKAKGMRAAEGAHELRLALDAIKNEIAPEKAPPSKSDAKVDGKKTALWDRLGGERGVRAVVKDFVAAAADDKRVNFTRDGKFKPDAKGVEQIENLLVELISETTGGPLKYSGKKTMKDVHAGMKITDDEFDAMMAVLQKTLEKHKVGNPEADELLKIVNSTRAVIVEVKDKE